MFYFMAQYLIRVDHGSTRKQEYQFSIQIQARKVLANDTKITIEISMFSDNQKSINYYDKYYDKDWNSSNVSISNPAHFAKISIIYTI